MLSRISVLIAFLLPPLPNAKSATIRLPANSFDLAAWRGGIGRVFDPSEPTPGVSDIDGIHDLLLFQDDLTIGSP
jgi:hypothetical protein